MAIVVQKGEGGYIAQLTPHGDHPWATEQTSLPTTRSLLRALGCHTTDIGDAFYEANSNWLDDTS
jgi:hypothetical protein